MASLYSRRVELRKATRAPKFRKSIAESEAWPGNPESNAESKACPEKPEACRMNILFRPKKCILFLFLPFSTKVSILPSVSLSVFLFGFILQTVEEKIARHSASGTVTEREIVVQFNADVADGMQWKFTPTPREVRVKPGESALAFYTAENKSSSPITGVSTYNVTPMKAGVYFNKIQCFCFVEQRLLPGEQIDMPVFFRTLIQSLKPIQEWTESIT